MLTRLTVLFLFVLAGIVSASAQDVEKALTEFEGKVLVLRHPLPGNSQQYDAKGNALKSGPEESWTTHSGILVEHIALTPDNLRVEGKRIFFLFQKDGLRLMKFKPLNDYPSSPVLQSAHVDIKLDPPIDSKAVDSKELVRTILGRVFALNTKDLLDSLPDYWRAYMANSLTYDASQKLEEEFRWQQPPPYNSNDKPGENIQPDIADDPKDADAEQPLFQIGKLVDAPQAKFTPEPEYPKIAQYEKREGMVVLSVIIGTDGKVHHLRLLRPLGMGLDEAARSAVETWRFQPAIHDGKPVAVAMSIEVAFDLHER